MNKRKDGRWEDTVKLPDGTTKHFYGKTQAEVKQKMAAWKETQVAGHPFTEAADAWQRDHTENVEHNTASSYNAPLRRAKEFFGDKPMAEITTAEVQAFIRYISEQGFARRTVQLPRDLMNMLFDHYIARRDSSVRYNPVDSVRLPKGLPTTRREPPAEDQLAKISPDTESDMGLFAYFLLYTGLRRGELLGLRWEAIDREAGIIRVEREVIYESNQPIVVDRAKTESSVREVDLLDVLAAVLPKRKHGYVFGGDKPLSKTQFRKEWTKFCREIGEADELIFEHKGANGRKYVRTEWKPRMTPHQFRHAYASMLDDAGLDETAAKALLGHKQISTTKDIYTHIRQGKRERAGKALNEFLTKSSK